MFTRVRRPSWWAVAAATAVLLTSACSGGTTDAGSSGTDSIVIGALPVIDDVSAYIAADEGIYQRFGLNVTLKQVTSSTVAITQMKAGTIDILGGGNYVSFIQEAAQAPNGNPPFKILAEGATCSAGSFNVLALSSSGIQTPANLAHKTIAVNIPDNIQTLTIDSVLTADGVNPATVKYVVIPFPKMGAALKAHKVDAISAVEPFATEAEQASGAEPILDQCSGPTSDIPLSGYFSTSTWAQQHPDVVKRFQEAITEAQGIADTNRLEVEKALLKYVTGLTAEEAGTITLEQFPTSADAVQLDRVSDLMREAGLLQAPVQAGSLIQG
jgi:NitT/TauT family transport system substrate-binding protein